MLSAQLNTIHNLRFYQRLMSGLRDAITEGQLDAFADEFYRKQAIGDSGGLNP
jgi:queuine tRNA-ribosyltransferase